MTNLKKLFICMIILLVTNAIFLMKGNAMDNTKNLKTIELPKPILQGQISVEQSIYERRSVRRFSKEALSIDDLSALLWAAQGITDKRGYRSAPSAGALYPLEVYIVVGNVDRIPEGIYKYVPKKHAIIPIVPNDKRDTLCRAALGQGAVKNAPVVMVFSAVFERTTGKYGERGIKYVFIEAGHAAQNVCLQAVSIGLGTVVIGAFDDGEVKKVLDLKTSESPLYIIPIGKPD